ncbi:MAG: hypothetical protein WCJ31_15200 [Planctomycetia bacterium]
MATKFADGDPCDHFCVGFVTRIAKLDGRIFVADGKGVVFRANGFRSAEVISPEEGAAIVAAMPTFSDKKGPSLWKRLECMRAAKAVMERNAASRERDALRAARITQSLTADRFASAVQEADSLRARVAELEAKLAPHANAVGGSNHAAQAASVGNRPETPVSSTQAASGGGDGDGTFFGAGGPFNFQYAEDSFFPPNVHGFLRQCVKIKAAPAASGGGVPVRASAVIREMIDAAEAVRDWAGQPLVRDQDRYRSEVDKLGVAIAAAAKLLLDPLPAVAASGLPPPEVVRPKVNRAAARVCVEIVEDRDAQWIAVLAAAGVAVKEVGCE